MGSKTFAAIGVVIISLILISVFAIKKAVVEQEKLETLNNQFSEYKKEKQKEIDDLKIYHEQENNQQAILADFLLMIDKRMKGVKDEFGKISNRPVYVNLCSDSDGVRIINTNAGKTPAEILNR